MSRPQAPGAEPVEDPTADSPPADPVVDWESRARAAEARVKDGQAAFTRKAQEAADLRRQLAEYEPDESESGEGDADVDVEPVPPVSSRFRAAESRRPRVPEPDRAMADHDAEAAELGRSIAEAVHGADVVTDAEVAMKMLEKATTTADRVTAFATFAELRNRAASAAPRRTPPAERLLTRDQAVQPRVETNRPDDAGYSSEVDASQFAAGANGGVGGWVRELLGSRRGPR